MSDFWPDFSPVELLPTPLAALEQQAALLPKKTNGLVGAVVVSGAEGSRMYANLVLTSSREPRYRYQLLQISYPLDHFPLNIIAGDETYEAKNDQEYLEKLKEILGSERTKRIVEAIMAHFKTRPVESTA